jgi:protein ImuB
VGQVAARKRSEITARFDASTVARLDEILGRTSSPISPRLPRAEYWKEQGFAEPIATLAVIGATLNALMAALSGIMEKDDMGARQLEALFFRTDGVVRRIAIDVGVATRDCAVVERLFREKLESLADPLDPGFGFDLIRLSAPRVERFTSGAVDLDSDLNSKRDIGFLIDRLGTRYGGQRILAFQPNDTHIPERAWVAVPAQQAQVPQLKWKKLAGRKGVPRRPLRFFARPHPVSLVASQPGSPHLSWRRVRQGVAGSEGPERIAMEWWRHEAPEATRDYFRMEDEEGRRYWLYRNTATAQWFLHGLFA